MPVFTDVIKVFFNERHVLVNNIHVGDWSKRDVTDVYVFGELSCVLLQKLKRSLTFFDNYS